MFADVKRFCLRDFFLFHWFNKGWRTNSQPFGRRLCAHRKTEAETFAYKSGRPLSFRYKNKPFPSVRSIVIPIEASPNTACISPCVFSRASAASVARFWCIMNIASETVLYSSNVHLTYFSSKCSSKMFLSLSDTCSRPYLFTTFHKHNYSYYFLFPF